MVCMYLIVMSSWVVHAVADGAEVFPGAAGHAEASSAGGEGRTRKAK